MICSRRSATCLAFVVILGTGLCATTPVALAQDAEPVDSFELRGSPAEVGGFLLLALAEDPDSPGSFLYRTDGTPAGSGVFAELPDVTLASTGGATSTFALFAERLPGRSELYRSDGTSVRRFATVPGSASDGVALGDQIVFMVDVVSSVGGPIYQPGVGEGFWVTDGTPEGTFQLADTTAELFLGGRLETRAVVLGDRLVAPDVGAFWSTDGTVSGTRRVDDIRMVSWFPEATDGRVVAFIGRETGGPNRIYATDGTASGTRVVLDGGTSGALTLLTGPAYEVASGLFYVLADPAGPAPAALWQFGDTLVEQRQVADLASLGYAGGTTGFRLLTSVDGRVFLVLDEDRESRVPPTLFEIEAGEVIPLGELDGDFAGFVASAGDRVFFRVEPVRRQIPRVTELWVTDGTPGSTRFYADLCPDRCDHPERVRAALGTVLALDRLAPNGASDLLAWAPDGPVQLTTFAGTGQDARAFVGEVGDRVVFWVETDSGVGATDRLWTTDGTLAGTVALPRPELTGTLRGVGPPLSQAPPVPARAALTSAQVPGFRVWVDITPRNADPIPATIEGACIPETLCVSGALPGRTEAFVRVIGPRPNGLLWPVVTRFTPSRVEVWIEQVGTGDLRYYDLPATDPDAATGDLTGLIDRDGFVPR